MTQPRDDLLGSLRTAQRDLAAELIRLSPADFDAPSACPGWTVRDALAHLRLLVSRYPTSVVLGLQGITDHPWTYPLPGETYEAADRREFAEMRQRPGAALASEFAALSGVKIELFARLTPEEQDLSVGTPRGVYKARHVHFFYANELTIHDWDIRAGRDPQAGLRSALRGAFARILRSRLPALVKEPVPPEAARSWRIALAPPVDQVWLLDWSNGRFRVAAATPDEAPPDLETDLDTLALVTSGRLPAGRALEQGRWQTRSPEASAAALHFGELFAGPV